MIRNPSLHLIDSVQESLDMISKKWKIPQEIYDLHIGKRNDIREEIVKVGQVFFHIPFLTNDNAFVLWSVFGLTATIAATVRVVYQ